MTHHDVMRHIDVLVNRVGWAVIKIVPTGNGLLTSYAYTVGLTEHFTDRSLYDQVVRARTL